MPLLPENKEQLRRLYGALADRVLEPGDPVYVSQLNTQGNHDAVEELATETEWQDGGGVCLFTGQRGTGKSTELKRLKKRLEDAGAVVFYADLAEYMLMSKEVEISDFLISICGAMSEKVSERFNGESPGLRSYWDRFALFMHSEVKITEFSTTLPGLEIKAALRSDPDFKRRVQEASRGHVARIVKDAHDFLAEAVDFVRLKLGDHSLRVVLLVDSVERIRGVGSDAMAVYESVRNLFFGHADHLRIPLLHVVYTIPPYLSVLASGTGLLMGGAVPRRLVSTHIFAARSRSPDPDGLALMRRVVEKRFPAWPTVFKQEALDQLALSSGGDLREYFRLIRLCLPSVRDDQQLPLDEQAVQQAENAARSEMLPIPADHLGWLKRISQTHETCLQTDADLPTLAHFLDNRLVLNYRNGSDWYDVHPLLREVVDGHVASTAAA